MKAPVDPAVALKPPAIAREIGVSPEEVAAAIRSARIPGRPLGRHARLYRAGDVYLALQNLKGVSNA